MPKFDQFGTKVITHTQWVKKVEKRAILREIILASKAK